MTFTLTSTLPGIFLRFARKRNRDPGRRTGRYSKGRTRRGSSTLFSITRRFKVGQLSRETFTRFRTPQFSLSFALRPLVPHPHLPVFYAPLPSSPVLQIFVKVQHAASLSASRRFNSSAQCAGDYFTFPSCAHSHLRFTFDKSN